MPEKRLACLYIPDFPLQVMLQARPELHRQPVIVAEQVGPAAPIAAGNHLSRRFDVTAGMTVARARSRCPHLQVLLRHREREDEESGRILKALQAIGPYVQEASAGLFFLETTGLQRLHGPECRLAGKILADIRSLRYAARVGVGANKLIAHLAARQTGDNTYLIVTPHEETGFLSPLPVSDLPLPEATVEKLRDLGIATVGALAELPPNEVTHRFGHEIMALAQYARGEDPSLLVPAHLAVRRRETLVLDSPLSHEPELSAAITPLMQKLLDPLQATGLGCRSILLEFTCDNHVTTPMRVMLDRASSSGATFQRQFNTLLERTHLPGRVSEIRLQAGQVEPLVTEQLSLTRQPRSSGPGTGPLPMELRQRGLYTITLHPTLLPEHRFSLTPISEGASADSKRSSPAPAAAEYRFSRQTIAGLRMYRTPRQTGVTVLNGTPATVSLSGYRRQVADCRGPWELSGEWWHGSFRRRYYEVETTDGHRLLLFHDRPGQRWFVQGIYD